MERQEHACEKERCEALAQKLETAVMQALTQRQELEAALADALAKHASSLAKVGQLEGE